LAWSKPKTELSRQGAAQQVRPGKRYGAAEKQFYDDRAWTFSSIALPDQVPAALGQEDSPPRAIQLVPRPFLATSRAMIRPKNGEPPAVHLARLMMKRAKRSSPRIAQENFLGEDCKDFLVVFSGPVFVLPLAAWGPAAISFQARLPQSIGSATPTLFAHSTYPFTLDWCSGVVN